MRRNMGGVLLAAGLVLLAAAPARAGRSLVSPPLFNSAVPYDTYTCMVLNTGPRPTPPDVMIALVGVGGATVVELGPFALAPNDPRVLIWEEGSVGHAYCRVTGSASPARTKITFCNGTSAGGPCEAVVTGP